MWRSSCTALLLFTACASADGEATGDELSYLVSCGDLQPPSPSACLFGDVFADLRTNPGLQITSETWIRSVEALTELEAQQLLLAVRESSHTDVVTAAEALARVDQREVRRVEFYELASTRWFAVYEYGVGDNSYGAYFLGDQTDVVASIHDGDVLDCSVVSAESGW